jgi:hypothetical protein
MRIPGPVQSVIQLKNGPYQHKNLWVALRVPRVKRFRAIITHHVPNQLLSINSCLLIHQAFSHLLSDRDEFTQEIASKGIGMVYDLGDRDVKDSLVGGLIRTWSEGRKIAAQTECPQNMLLDSKGSRATNTGRYARFVYFL